MSNQVANEMARKKAEDLLSPLLEAEARPDDDGSAASAATNELEQRTPLQKLKTLAGACPRPSRPPSSPSPGIKDQANGTPKVSIWCHRMRGSFKT